MFLTGSKPPEPRATRSPSADQPPTPRMPKGEAQMYANMRTLWEEEDELAKQPVRWESRHDDVR